MSYDKIMLLNKDLHMIIAECNIAHLDLVVHSEYRENKATSGIVYRTSFIEQEYERVLDTYGIDKSKNFQKSFWKVLFYEDIFLEYFGEYWRIELFLRQTKKYTFLTYHTFIGEIENEVKKSRDKVTSITKYLKTLHLLQYCKREDLKKELTACFLFFVQQLEVLISPERLGLVSKTIVKVLKTFCVTDFMKEIILCNPTRVLLILLTCSKRQKYNFCGIFQVAEEESYPVAWTLMENCLQQLEILLKHGVRNPYSKQIHWCFFKDLIVRMVGYNQQDTSFLGNVFMFNKRNYLAMQVIYLYLLELHGDSLLTTQILMLLWKNVNDSFLTKQEILSLFEPKPAWANELFFNCWQWYYNNVIYKETSEHVQCMKTPFYKVSPRSLKHLARCAVRKNLAASYLEPPYFTLIGHIPQDLQNYLLINS